MVSVVTEDGSVLPGTGKGAERCVVVASTELCYLYERYAVVVALDLSASMFAVTRLPGLSQRSAASNALGFALPADQLVPLLKGILLALFHPSKRRAIKEIPFQPRYEFSVLAYCPCAQGDSSGIHIVAHRVELTAGRVAAFLEGISHRLRELEESSKGQTRTLNLQPLVQSAVLALEAHDTASCPLMLLLSDGAWESAREKEAEALRLARRDIPCHVAHIRGKSQSVVTGSALAHLPNMTQVRMLVHLTHGGFIQVPLVRKVLLDANRLAAARLCQSLLLRRSLGSVEAAKEDLEGGGMEGVREEEAVVVHEVLDYVLQCEVEMEELVACRIKEGFVLCQMLADDQLLCVRLSMHWGAGVVLHYIIKAQTARKKNHKLVVRLRLKARAEMMRAFYALGRVPRSEQTDEERKICLRLHRFINSMQETDRVEIFLRKLHAAEEGEDAALELDSDDSASQGADEPPARTPRSDARLERTLLAFSAEEVRRWNRWLDLSTFDLVCPNEAARAAITSAVQMFAPTHCFSGDKRTLFAMRQLQAGGVCFLRIRFLTEYLATIHLAFPMLTPTHLRLTLQRRVLAIIRQPPSLHDFAEVEAEEEQEAVPNYVTEKRLRRLAYPSLHAFLEEDSSTPLAEAFSMCKRWEWVVPDRLSGKEAMRHLVRARLCEGFLLLASSFEVEALKKENGTEDLLRMEFKNSRSSSLRMDENPHVSFCRVFDTVDGRGCLVQYCLTLADTNALSIHCWIEHTGSMLPLRHNLTVQDFFQLLIEHFTNVDGCLVSASVEFMRIQAAATSVWDVLLDKDKAKDEAKAEADAEAEAHVGIASLLQLATMKGDNLQFFKQLGSDTPSQANVYLYDRLQRTCSKLADRQVSQEDTTVPLYAKVVDSDTIVLIELMPLELARYAANSEAEGWYNVDFPLNLYELNRNNVSIPASKVAEQLQESLGYLPQTLAPSAATEWTYTQTNRRLFPLTSKAGQGSAQALALFKSKLYAAHDWNFTRSMHQALYADHKEVLHVSDISRALNNCAERITEVDVRMLRTILFRTCRSTSTPSTSTSSTSPSEKNAAKSPALEEIDEQFRDILADFFEEVPGTEYYIFMPKVSFKSAVSDSDEEEDAMSSSVPEYEMSSEEEERDTALRPLDGAPPLVFLRMGCSIRLGGVDSEETFTAIVKGELSSVLLSHEEKPHAQASLSFICSTITGDVGEDKKFTWTDLVKEKLRRRVKAMVSASVLNSLRRVYPVTETTIALVKDLFDHGSLSAKAISRVTVPLVFMDHSPLVNTVFGKEMAKSPFLSVRSAGNSDIYFVVESPSASTSSPAAASASASSNAASGASSTGSLAVSPGSSMRVEWNKREYNIPYWALITLRGPSVTIEFHHPPRSTPLEVGHLVDYLRNGVLRTAERVNQMTLLYQLHESRIASSLLIPPDNIDSDSERDRDRDREAPEEREGLDAELGSLSLNLARFPVGRFACPCFYRERIDLPERLHAKLAMRELVGNALQQFLVSNRTNTFVYRDSHGKVYYMKLKEVDEKTLMLEVYGVDALSKEIEETLSNLLTNKVASLTLNALTSFLQRNPQFKLQPYDISFICATQPERPMQRFSLDLPAEVTDHFLFIAYLRQNLLSFMVDLNVALPEGTAKRQTDTSALIQHPASWGDTSMLKDATVQHPASFDLTMTSSFPSASPAMSAEHVGPNALPLRVRLRNNDNAMLFVSELSSFKHVGKGIALSFINLTRSGVAGKYVAETTTINEASAGVKASAAELSQRRLSTSSTLSGSTNASSTKATAGVTPSTPKTPEHIRSAAVEQEDTNMAGGGFSITIESWARGQIELGKLKEHQFEAFNQTLHEYTFEVLHVERPIHVDATGMSSSIDTLSANLDDILASSRHLSRPAPSFQSFQLPLHQLIYASQRSAFLAELNRIISFIQPQLTLLNVSAKTEDSTDFSPCPLKPDKVERVGQEKRHSGVEMVIGSSQLVLGFEEIEAEEEWLAACRYGEAGFLGENLTVLCTSASGFVSSETLYHPHLELAARRSFSTGEPELVEPTKPLWQLYQSREEEPQTAEVTVVRKRNCFVLISIKEEKLLVRTYNWSLNATESLRDAILHTTAWVTLRMNLLENMLYQKLGLFFHAPIDVLSYKFCQANCGKEGVSRMSLEVLDMLKRSPSFMLKDTSQGRSNVSAQSGSSGNVLSNSFQSSAELQKEDTSKYKRELKPLTVEEVLPFIRQIVPPPQYLSFLMDKGKAERTRKASNVSITKPRHKSVGSHGNSTAVTAAITAGRLRSKYRPGMSDSAGKKSMEAVQFQLRPRKRPTAQTSIYAESDFMFQLMGLSPNKPGLLTDGKVKDLVEVYGEQLRVVAKEHNTNAKKESTVLSLVSQWRQNYHPVSNGSIEQACLLMTCRSLPPPSPLELRHPCRIETCHGCLVSITNKLGRQRQVN